MDFLTTLWLPILLAALAAWMWSFISWAAANLHRGDYRKIPAEDQALSSVRALNLPPGHYMFPYMTHSKDPAAAEKWKTGPTGTLFIMRQASMGGNVLKTLGWFLFSSVLIGYLASAALPPGTGFGKVFQVVGTAGVLAYCVSSVPNMIWFQAHRSTVVITLIDGLIQGLAAGAIFAALWPKG